MKISRPTTPPIRSITNSRLAFDSVSVDNIDFIKPGKNLFNKDTIINNSIVSSTTGNVVTNQYTASFSSSDFIKIDPAKSYYINGWTRGWAYYDANYNFISGGTSQFTNGILAIPANAAFFRNSFDTNVADKIQMEEGAAATTYEPYRLRMEYSRGVELSLPDKYELVVGHKFELFYKGIVLANNPYNYQIKVNCAKGMAFRRKFEYTPLAADVGTHVLSVSIYDDDDILLDTKEVDLIVSVKASNPSATKNVLCVGDSLTAGGQWVTELHRMLVDVDGLSNVNFIGTQGTTVKYEAYGGWRFYEYNTQGRGTGSVLIDVSSGMKTETDQMAIYKDANNATWKIEMIYTSANQLLISRQTGTTALPVNGTLTWVSGGIDVSDIVFTLNKLVSQNPFWNIGTEAVDFATYATDLGITTIDYVYVLLGWNNSGDNEAEYKPQARTFINNLRSAFPDSEIVLVGIHVPDIDGLGMNYGATWSFKDKIKFVFTLNKWLMELTTEFTNVDFVNLAGQFDTEYNMPAFDMDVNARNSTDKETRGTNGVHPANSGYLQIADAVYRDINSKL